MAALDLQIEDRLDRIERMLEELLRGRQRAVNKRLLSKRAAARLLGVDRGTTLEQWIRDGHLRLVHGKIPDVEIERLLADGLPEERPRARRRQPETRDEAAAIRELKV